MGCGQPISAAFLRNILEVSCVVERGSLSLIALPNLVVPASNTQMLPHLLTVLNGHSTLTFDIKRDYIYLVIICQVDKNLKTSGIIQVFFGIRVGW